MTQVLSKTSHRSAIRLRVILWILASFESNLSKHFRCPRDLAVFEILITDIQSNEIRRNSDVSESQPLSAKPRAYSRVATLACSRLFAAFDTVDRPDTPRIFPHPQRANSDSTKSQVDPNRTRIGWETTNNKRFHCASLHPAQATRHRS